MQLKPLSNNMYIDGKRYYALDNYLKTRFGKKLYKIALNGGMSCPNRDGTLSYGGCIFCSEGGSGDFASSPCLPIAKQIEDGKQLLSGKADPNTSSYIAYFQAFTNTYAPVDYLEKIFTEAIEDKSIAALSIATRPDCIDECNVNLLKKLNKIKPVFVELGLQTSNEETAKFINRGYSLNVFEQAVRLLRQSEIEVIVHVILGLPGETVDDMTATIDYLNSFDIQGVKLQLLHVLKNTALLKYYNEQYFSTLSLEEYVDIVVKCIEHLREDVVIHRLTGDGPRDLLVSPMWSTNKKLVLNTINKTLKSRNTYQGRLTK